MFSLILCISNQLDLVNNTTLNNEIINYMTVVRKLPVPPTRKLNIMPQLRISTESNNNNNRYSLDEQEI